MTDLKKTIIAKKIRCIISMFFEVIAREREKEPDEEGDEKGITKIILHLTIVRQSCAKKWPELKKCKKQLEKWKKTEITNRMGWLSVKLNFMSWRFEYWTLCKSTIYFTTPSYWPSLNQFVCIQMNVWQSSWHFHHSSNDFSPAFRIGLFVHHQLNCNLKTSQTFEMRKQ